MTKTIGELIKEKRDSLDLSRNEFIKKFLDDVDIQELYRWETDKKLPQDKHHVELSKLLEITIEEVRRLCNRKQNLLPFLKLIMSSGQDEISIDEFEFLWTDWKKKTDMTVDLLNALLRYHRREKTE